MIDVVIVSSYLLAVLYIGYRASGGVYSMRTYSVSDKGFPSSFLVATLFATWIGGDDLIGVTERIYSVGIIFMFVCWTQMFGLLVYMHYIVRVLLEKFRGAVSVGDVMQDLYGDIGQVLCGVSCVFFSIGYASLQISCMGYLCNTFIGIPHFWGAAIGTAVMIAYSSFGGIKAVVWTDFLQFGVFMIAIPVIASVVLADVGGIQVLISKVPRGLAVFDIPRRDIIECVLIAIYCITPIISPAAVQRILMAKNVRQAKNTFKITGILYLPFYLMITLIGFCALVLFPGIDPNTAFLKVVDTYTHTGVRGLAIIGILAVLMSTADSFFNIATIAAVVDVTSVLKKDVSEKLRLVIARVFCVFYGIACLFVAECFTRMVDFFLFFSNFWTATVSAPLVLYIFFDIRLSKKQYLYSAAVGLISIVVFLLVTPKEYHVISQLFGLMTAMILGITLKYLNGEKIVGGKDNRPVVAVQCSGVFAKFRKYKLQFEFSNLSPKVIFGKLVDYSAKAVDDYGAKYRTFGAFSLVNYMMPFYMWSEVSANKPSILLIRIIAGIISFMLVVHDAWPRNWKNYLPLFWHFCVLFCLPFLTTYMILFEGPTLFWVINFSLAIVMGLIILDVKSFVYIYSLGAFIATMLMLIEGNPIMIFNISYASLYLFVFSVVIVVLFFRDKQNIEKIKIDAINQFASAVLHEMKTKIATVRLSARSVIRVTNGEEVLEGESVNTSVNKSAHVIANECTGMFNYIREIIDNLCINEYGKQSPILASINVRELVDAVIEQHYANSEFKEKITLDLQHDFSFKGSSIVMKQVIFNILQNAVYQIKSANKGNIIITTRFEFGHDILSIKDTAGGVAPNMLEKIFTPFITNSVGGTGIGLAFCKKVIEDMGGEIYCKSVKGQFAEFVIEFLRQQ